MSRISIDTHVYISYEKLVIHLHVSGEINTDDDFEPGDDDEPGEYEDDSDDDPEGLNWPPVNYN